METLRRSGRKIKSRVIKVDGFTVLRANNYSLEEGERSVFDQELGKQEEGSATPTLGVKRKTPTKKPKAPPSQEQLARVAYREQVGRLRAEHNKRIDDDVAASLDRRALFFAALAPLLEPFLETSVLEKILQSAADARGRGVALPPPARIDFQPECVVGGEMREYQLKGLAYLVGTFDNGISALLADEMGLGKTLQTIAFLGYLKHCRGVNGPHLVVCPLSVMASWMSEFQRWCPTLHVIRLHTGDHKEQERLRREILANISAFDVIVTTYDMLQSNKMVLQQMIHWRYLVLDEGHKVKNEETLVSNAVRHVHRQATLLLTGTPLQNNLHELWVLLNHIYPDVFTTSTVFDKAFDLTQHLVNDDLLEKAHKLLQKLSLRRIKSEVEAKLPPKIETKIFCPLAPMQNFWYQKLLENEASLLANVDARGTGLDEEHETDEYKKLRNLLMQLRKCCNHPYMFPGAEEDPGSINEEIVQASGKMQVMDRLLTKLKAAGHRVVLFSQFTETLDIIDDYLNMRGHKFARLDGATNRIQRMVDIMTFNRPNSDLFVFLLSTRAGGLGVNLQTADTLILFDSDWNPQVDMQAMARVHRIGQTKPVHVYRLVTGGTVEERIQLRAEKKLYLDQMVNRGSTAMAESLETLGSKEIMAMLKFGAQAIFKSQGAQLTDEDIDVIIDRTRTGAPQLSNKIDARLMPSEQTAAKFDKAELPTEIAMFQGRDYRKAAQGKKAALGSIAEEWAQNNPKSNRHKSTLVKVGTDWVLKKNMYTMETGEPSTFGRERMSDERELAMPKKRSLQRAGRDYQHMDECLFCWNDGLLVMCDGCPAAYHPNCIGVDERSLKHIAMWMCPHHACAVCNRKAAAVGGMLFRCEGCPLSFCEDHLPATADIIGHCKGFEELGMRHPNQACYIRCGKPCADYMAYRSGEKSHWEPKGEVDSDSDSDVILVDEKGPNVPKKARSKTQRTDGQVGSPSRFALPASKAPTFSFAALSTIAGNAGDMTGKGGAGAIQYGTSAKENETVAGGSATQPTSIALNGTVLPNMPLASLPLDKAAGVSQPSADRAGQSQPLMNGAGGSQPVENGEKRSQPSDQKEGDAEDAEAMEGVEVNVKADGNDQEMGDSGSDGGEGLLGLKPDLPSALPVAQRPVEISLSGNPLNGALNGAGNGLAGLGLTGNLSSGVVKEAGDGRVGQGLSNNPSNDQDLSNNPSNDQVLSNNPSNGQGLSNNPSNGQGLSNNPSNGQGLSNNPSDGQKLSNNPSNGALDGAGTGTGLIANLLIGTGDQIRPTGALPGVDHQTQAPPGAFPQALSMSFFPARHQVAAHPDVGNFSGPRFGLARPGQVGTQLTPGVTVYGAGPNGPAFQVPGYHAPGTAHLQKTPFSVPGCYAPGLEHGQVAKKSSKKGKAERDGIAKIKYVMPAFEMVPGVGPRFVHNPDVLIPDADLGPTVLAPAHDVPRGPVDKSAYFASAGVSASSQARQGLAPLSPNLPPPGDVSVTSQAAKAKAGFLEVQRQLEATPVPMLTSPADVTPFQTGPIKPSPQPLPIVFQTPKEQCGVNAPPKVDPCVSCRDIAERVHTTWAHGTCGSEEAHWRCVKRPPREAPTEKGDRSARVFFAKVVKEGHEIPEDWLTLYPPLVVKGVTEGQRNSTKTGAFTRTGYMMEQSSEESDDEGGSSDGGWPFWDEDLYYHFGNSSESDSAGSAQNGGSFGYHFESSEESDNASEEDPLILDEGASLDCDDEQPLEDSDDPRARDLQAEESLSDCVGRPSDASDGSQSSLNRGSQAQEEERIPVTCNKVPGQLLLRAAMVECQCERCTNRPGKDLCGYLDGVFFFPEWERHCGSRSKKWKGSIHVQLAGAPATPFGRWLEQTGKQLGGVSARGNLTHPVTFEGVNVRAQGAGVNVGAQGTGVNGGNAMQVGGKETVQPVDCGESLREIKSNLREGQRVLEGRGGAPAGGWGSWKERLDAAQNENQARPLLLELESVVQSMAPLTAVVLPLPAGTPPSTAVRLPLPHVSGEVVAGQAIGLGDMARLEITLPGAGMELAVSNGAVEGSTQVEGACLIEKPDVEESSKGQGLAKEGTLLTAGGIIPTVRDDARGRLTFERKTAVTDEDTPMADEMAGDVEGKMRETDTNSGGHEAVPLKGGEMPVNQNAVPVDTTSAATALGAAQAEDPVSMPDFSFAPVPLASSHLPGGQQQSVTPVQATPLVKTTGPVESPFSLPQATPTSFLTPLAIVDRNAGPFDAANVTPAPMAVDWSTPSTFGSLDSPMEIDVSKAPVAPAKEAEGRAGRRADLSPYGLVSWGSES